MSTTKVKVKLKHFVELKNSVTLKNLSTIKIVEIEERMRGWDQKN